MRNFPKTIYIIGLGLIGCTIAANLKKKTQSKVIGIDSQLPHIKQAKELLYIDEGFQEITEIVADSLVVLATPLSAMESIFQKIFPLLHDDVALTDVGSVKSSVVGSAKNILREKACQFIPAHPLAGRAISGPAAAQLDLFVGKKVILTPFTNHSEEALVKISALWDFCGAMIEEMDADQHDEIVAHISHLPQLLSFSYMNSFKGYEGNRKYGAGGFSYLTKLAASHPVMWRDICIANKTKILEVLERYKKSLADIEERIKVGSEDLLSLFELSNRLLQAPG